MRHGARHRDTEQAARFYEMAAEQGHSKAQYNLAFCRLFGRGGDANTEEAARLFLSAAQQGIMQAQYATGCCYMLGLGIKRDLAESGNEPLFLVQTTGHVSSTCLMVWRLVEQAFSCHICPQVCSYFFCARSPMVCTSITSRLHAAQTARRIEVECCHSSKIRAKNEARTRQAVSPSMF
jgi:hypothetical protein